MKKLLISFFLVVIFIFVQSADAKVLPQSSRGGLKPAVVKSAGTTIGVFPRLRADRRALIVNFTNLQNAKVVSYMLVYKHDGQEEGAMGGLTLHGQPSETTELLFATCSNGICRYHSNIKDARLEVSYTSTNGKKYLKKFKIKV